VLKDQFFNTRDWALSSQQPPTDEASDLRRVELRIERWINHQWQTILFFEAKKQKCSQTEIDELEFQAYNACIAHLAYTRRDQMYAMTVIGTSARLWYITKRDDYLLPFVPIDPGLSERAKYIEAHSTDAQHLRNGLNYIIQNDKVSSEKLQVLRSNCSPRTRALTGDETRSSTFSTPGMPAAQLTYGLTQPSAVERSFAYTSSQIDAGLSSSANPVAPGGSANTPLAEIDEDEDDEMDEDDSEPVAAISPDTPYVDVTRKVVAHTFREDEVFYCFNGRETTKKSWKSSTILYGGIVRSCLVYTSSKGSTYWTWALPKGKGKKV
jgi:hypothetical protein